MRIEKRMVPITKEERVYIADDGRVFDNKFDCEIYEYKQLKNKYELEHKECRSLNDESATLWYIHSNEEYEWLKRTAWLHGGVISHFENEGWYIAIKHDGGDYPDEYDVIPLNDYICEHEEKIQDLKDLTNS